MTRILIAENDEQNIALMSEYFEVKGWQVDFAVCSLEVIYLCNNHEYNYLIINQKLQDFNAVQILSNLRMEAIQDDIVILCPKLNRQLRSFAEKHKLTLLQLPLKIKKLHEIFIPEFKPERL